MARKKRQLGLGAESWFQVEIEVGSGSRLGVRHRRGSKIRLGYGLGERKSSELEYGSG